MQESYEQQKSAINVKIHKELPLFTKLLCFLFPDSFNAVSYKIISRQYERGFLTSVQFHESQEIKNIVISGEKPLTK